MSATSAPKPVPTPFDFGLRRPTKPVSLLDDYNAKQEAAAAERLAKIAEARSHHPAGKNFRAEPATV